MPKLQILYGIAVTGGRTLYLLQKFVDMYMIESVDKYQEC